MTSNIGITRAHTNIALIKYWGKENKELFIPMNSSLSLTLEAFYTDTKVELTDALTEDEFYLNGAKQDEAATAKITRFLDLFRAENRRYASCSSGESELCPNCSRSCELCFRLCGTSWCDERGDKSSHACSKTIYLRSSW